MAPIINTSICENKDLTEPKRNGKKLFTLNYLRIMDGQSFSSYIKNRIFCKWHDFPKAWWNHVGTIFSSTEQ